MKKENNVKQKRRSLILILLALVLLIIVYFVVVKSTSTKETTNSTEILNANPTEEYNNDDSVLTEEAKALPMELTIISPEGDSFSKGQARLWKAELKNFSEGTSRFGYCSWKFFLNENNQEVLYKEQETRSLMEKDQPSWCGFTSTFIEKPGILRAEVTMTFKDGQEITGEPLVAQRQYLVK